MRLKSFLLAIVLAAGCPFNISAQQAASETVAFVGANVVPMDRERVLENQTVLVTAGRIVEIGPAASVRVPGGATRIDARGKFLMPGLCDMHGHLVPGEGANGDGPSQIMKLYLANGVTTVRGMIGHPTNLVVRDKIARGEMPGPRVYAAGPAVNQKLAPTPEAGVKVVEAHKAAGYDLIKIHEGLSPATFEAIAAAAKRVGIRIAGHVSDTIGLDRAIGARQSSIEHLDGYLQALVPANAPAQPVPGQVQFGPALAYMDEAKIAALAARTKEAGIWNTPTLALFEIIVSSDAPETFALWPELAYVPQGMRDGFMKQKAGTAGIPASPEDRKRFVELRRHVVKGLHDAGANLLVGPDSPQLFLVPGFATHREMASLVAAGLTPFAVLQAATTSAAEYLGTTAETGTVATGKRADLLLLDANPLQDIANAHKIAGVMANGRWMPRTEIERMLAEIAALHKQ
jgi:imidazolonepropionase-like amidohydrolase